MITNVTFRCDRDGAELVKDSMQMPEGWGTISAMGIAFAVNGNLCPTCLAGFIEFMNATGGSFSLSPPLPQTLAPVEKPEPAEPPAVETEADR